MVDHCRGTQPVRYDELAHGWAEVFNGLPLGLTHLALHCTVVSDFAAMSQLHTPRRHAEHELIASGEFDQMRATADVEQVGMRALQMFGRRVYG